MFKYVYNHTIAKGRHAAEAKLYFLGILVWRSLRYGQY